MIPTLGLRMSATTCPKQCSTADRRICTALFRIDSAVIARKSTIAMPKKVMKYNLKKSQPWPAPKRGKARALLKKHCSKKTTSQSSICKAWAAKKNRGHRERWGRSIPDFLSTGRRLIQMLNQDKLFRSLTGKTCPTCAQGVLGKAEYRKNRDRWVHKCNAKGCQARIRVECRRSSSTFRLWLSEVLQRNAAPLILDVDHKTVKRIYTNRELAMAQHVGMKDSKICCGSKHGSD